MFIYCYGLHRKTFVADNMRALADTIYYAILPNAMTNLRRERLQVGQFQLGSSVWHCWLFLFPCGVRRDARGCALWAGSGHSRHVTYALRCNVCLPSSNRT